MIPKSFSASALQVAELCLARYKFESLDRTPSIDNNAAMLGTSLHAGLEKFIKAVCIDKTHEWKKDLLIDFYKIGYIETFQSSNFESPEFLDGLEIIEHWYSRTDPIKDTVVSCEVKESFVIPTSAGEIPFNFIWDRADQLDDMTYRVVDYKSYRRMMNADDLRSKIQARAYALAAQIKWPHAERIWVTFDMLRYDQIGVVFTKEDNIAFWKYLKRTAERIIQTPDENIPETLNLECNYCPRKIRCNTLLRAAEAGSTLFSTTPEEAAKSKLLIDSSIKALTSLNNELDAILVKEAEQRDELEWSQDGIDISIGASRRRTITNAAAISKIVGPELSSKYGSFNVTSVDKMLKSGELSLDQISQVKEMIGYKWGEPSAKVKPSNPIGD